MPGALFETALVKHLRGFSRPPPRTILVLPPTVRVEEFAPTFSKTRAKSSALSNPLDLRRYRYHRFPPSSPEDQRSPSL